MDDFSDLASSVKFNPEASYVEDGRTNVKEIIRISKENSYEVKTEIYRAEDGLRGRGVNRHFDGAMIEVVREATNIIIENHEAIVAYFTLIYPIVKKWLKNKDGRSFRILDGEKEIKLNGFTKKEIERVLKNVKLERQKENKIKSKKKKRKRKK